MLSQGISFNVPEQDLTFSLARMPTYPRSGVCLGNVRQQKSIAEEEPELPVACPERLRRSK